MALDPRQQAEHDQARQTLQDTIPPLAKSLYDGFKEQGFSDTQSLTLVNGYIQAMVNAFKP